MIVIVVFPLFPQRILCILCDNLPASDVVKAQDVIGIYLGNSYWRSGFPTDFLYEIEKTMEETLDWELLCLGLEELEQLPAMSGGLACRQYILKHLDKVQGVVTMG